MRDLALESRITHKGWWLFCPVWLGDLGTDCPIVIRRWFWCAPLYWAATLAQGTAIYLGSLLCEDYEPSWYLMVTGPVRGDDNGNEG